MQRTKLASIVCGGLICLLGSAAFAQPEKPYEPKIVPQCHRYTLVDGKEVCGYGLLSQVQAVYNADAELFRRREEAKLYQKKTNLLVGQVKDLRVAVEAQKKATAIIRDRNVDLTKELIDTDRKYQLERARPRWGNPIAWGIAAGCAALAAGTIAVAVLD